MITLTVFPWGLDFVKGYKKRLARRVSLERF